MPKAPEAQKEQESKPAAASSEKPKVIGTIAPAQPKKDEAKKADEPKKDEHEQDEPGEAEQERHPSQGDTQAEPTLHPLQPGHGQAVAARPPRLQRQQQHRDQQPEGPW